MEVRAAVLHEPGRPLVGRAGRARRPARRARCSSGSPRRACATPTCTSPTATSARAAGRSCSATRAPAWSRRSARAWPGSRPATASRSASCRAACAAARAAPAASTCARRSCRTRGRARCSTARRACGWRDGAAAPALQLRLLLRRALRRARGERRRRCPTGCRCGRRRSSAAPWSPASARWRNAARVGAGDTVCVIGCGGVGLQIVAAARAGRRGARSSPSTATRASSRSRAGAARPTPSTRGPATRRRRVLALVPGGVDHAFEAIGRAGHDPPGVGRAAPGRDGDRRRHRPARHRGPPARARAAVREGPARLLLRLRAPGDGDPPPGRARRRRRASAGRRRHARLRPRRDRGGVRAPARRGGARGRSSSSTRRRLRRRADPLEARPRAR